MKTYAKTVTAIAVGVLFAALWAGSVEAAAFQVSGSVTTQSGFGIASVTVAVIDPLIGTTVASTVTDTSGNYTMSVASGIYTITATPHAGDYYQTATKTNQSITGDTTINFTLAPVTGTIALSGRIVDGLGNALPDQTVSVQTVSAGGSSATTDAAGRYSLQTPPGTVYVHVGVDSYHPQLDIPMLYGISTSALTITQDTTVDIALPLKRVTLHVQDANSAPVASVTIGTSCQPGLPVTLGGNLTGTANCSYSPAPIAGLHTDGAGNETLWLFPAAGPTLDYTITAFPPAGSNNPITALSGIAVTDDTTLTIVLQVTIVTGPPGGGTSATFAGTGFQSGTQVSFGGVPATSVTLLSSGSVSTLSAVAPAHAPGTVDVTITNPNGQTVTISGGYHYADPLSLQVIVAPGAPTTLKVGQRVQLKAMATYNDGSTGDVTGQVQWSSGNMSVARVDASGMVTGVAAGAAQITAQFGSLPPSQITVTVGAGTPIGIPAPPLPPGRSGPPSPSGPPGPPPAPIPVGR